MSRRRVTDREEIASLDEELVGEIREVPSEEPTSEKYALDESVPVAPTPDVTRLPNEAAADASDAQSVRGERGIESINRTRSLQARMTQWLAMGLIGSIGIGLLGWYYMKLATAPPPNAGRSRAASQGEMALPALGNYEMPKVQASDERVGLDGADDASTLAEDLFGPPPEELPENIPAAWLAPAQDGPAPQVGANPYAATVKTPEELAMERRLAGPVHAAGSGSGLALASAPVPAESVGDPGALAQRLVPTETTAARAQVLPTSTLLLPKGAFIDCTLETAIDSTLPGLTTCVTATDTFGVDGTTVLMERGTKLVGETQGEVRQGAARVFVLWSEARTPAGVMVPLASPGTDELGRSGLPGRVDRHFMERFGAAILISVIDGAIDAASSDNSDSIVLDSSSSRDLVTEVLKSTVNIPPTVVKRHGDRVQVIVARDLDFRSVYELVSARE